jgi:hypothetical protein
VSWPVLKRSYFETVALVNDPVWRNAARVIPIGLLLVIYRVGFLWGITRVTAWVLWVHVFHSNPMDLSWGGPYWVTPIR